MERTLRNYLAQTVIVALFSAALVLATDAVGFRSPANFLWMVALPAFVGVAVNRGWKARASMMVALVAVSLVSSVLIGVNFTTYG